MTKMNSALRIGRINYTNVWPVFHHFPEHLKEEVEIVSEVPTGLNRAMAAGDIHIGPISSFSYAEHAEHYDLFPNLSVSCLGRVNSILLFHRKPLSELKYSRVALPTTSATSVNLLKIILRRFYDIEPEYFYAAPSLGDMMKEADAALLIGDDAIRASWSEQSDLQITDLGDLWKRWTGEWMTYAVWAVRRDAAASAPSLIQAVYQAFQNSKRMGTHDPRPMVEQAIREIGGDMAYWNMYFRQLCHDFAKPQQSGLALYFNYAQELGLLERHVPIQLWDNHTVA